MVKIAAPRRRLAGPGTMLGLVLLVGAARAEEAPRPPCQAAPWPAYPAATEAQPVLMVTQAKADSTPWTPPACTGWSAGGPHGYHTRVALAGRFQLPPGQEEDAVLARLGAISALRHLPYWAENAGAWRPFAADATALAGPDPDLRRADFSAAELASGGSFYFLQKSGRLSSQVIYRMRVTRDGPGRLLVRTENVSPVRFLLVTLFQPGAVQTLQVVERLGPGEWGYYGLFRTQEAGTSTLADGHERFYANRVEAVYRFIAGAAPRG